MNTRTTTADSSADIGLAAGEHWIEHVPAARTWPHQISFPAVIEPRRHQGLWVRPRLRREVARALCEWLNLVYPTDPDWYPLARFDNDLLVVFTGEAAHQRHEIPPDEVGRYPLADLGCWFLSTPTRTAARIAHELAVLSDRTRREPRPGETLVACNPANAAASAFPARIDTRSGQPLIPVFRPEIAEAVAAFCTTHHDLAPNDYPAGLPRGPHPRPRAPAPARPGQLPALAHRPRRGRQLRHRRRRVDLPPRPEAALQEQLTKALRMARQSSCLMTSSPHA
ncbi:hypothetical protein ACFWQL_22330 [Amycolatopsis thermoflava]|uniref:hypothetical protein n=1 Tax=Amycolatopsis thermoflava TaxID=84480 RepID=UPI003663C766